jgi:hypothetical protein
MSLLVALAVYGLLSVLGTLVAVAFLSINRSDEPQHLRPSVGGPAPSSPKRYGPTVKEGAGVLRKPRRAEAKSAAHEGRGVVAHGSSPAGTTGSWSGIPRPRRTGRWRHEPSA